MSFLGCTDRNFDERFRPYFLHVPDINVPLLVETLLILNVLLTTGLEALTGAAFGHLTSIKE